MLIAQTVTLFTGQHTVARCEEELLAAPPAWSGQTGQTGRRAQRRRSDERSPGRDPVGTSACRVALGSAGQLGRPQTPWRREKYSMSKLEKLG